MCRTLYNTTWDLDATCEEMRAKNRGGEKSKNENKIRSESNADKVLSPKLSTIRETDAKATAHIGYKKKVNHPA